MSLIGPTTAFISIGISCQGSFQLATHRSLLSSLVDEPLSYRSSLFNWVMVSADAVADAIERAARGPIESSSILVPSRHMRCNRIAGQKIWLWHEKPSHETTADVVLGVASKYEHLRRNFLELCSRPIRHFVLCNTQNDIEQQDPHREEGMSLSIDDRKIEEVRRTLDRLFPAGANRLLVVGRPDRMPYSMREPVYVPPFDMTYWHGQTEAWGGILTSYLGARRANIVQSTVSC